MPSELASAGQEHLVDLCDLFDEKPSAECFFRIAAHLTRRDPPSVSQSGTFMGLPCIARQTRSSVAGMSRWRTP
jgi:hypothetical protein